MPLGNGQYSSEPDSPAVDGLQEPAQASMAAYIDDGIGNRNRFYLELQEANNILNAAYKEIITMALEAKTWVLTAPAFGSMEEHSQMFRRSPPSGMKVERSIESADIEIAPELLVSIMMDANIWASSLSHIVYHGCRRDPPGFLKQFRSANCGIRDLHMVNAEFQLPTPLVRNRKFCFLRFKKEITSDAWAIVDLSIDYFPSNLPNSTLERKCRRRPSGVIIRRCGEFSQVIWIENVEVYECQSQDNMYSATINSDSAFSARRWVSSLLWNLERDGNSMFTNVNKMELGPSVDKRLLQLTENMKIDYLKCVNEAVDATRWTTLFDHQGVRILKNIAELGSNRYVVVTSFRVQANPRAVYYFLINKNLRLQWPSLPETGELIKLATADESNCITIHQKFVLQNESRKFHEYLLQEASREESFCFVISAPMSHLEYTKTVVYENQGDVFLHPSGFAIMPDGPEGNASLVTIARQQQLDGIGTGQAIVDLRNLISAIVGEIKEEVTRWSEASSRTLEPSDLGNK